MRYICATEPKGRDPQICPFNDISGTFRLLFIVCFYLILSHLMSYFRCEKEDEKKKTNETDL